MTGLSNPDTCEIVFLLNFAKMLPLTRVVTLPANSQGYDSCIVILRQI